MVSTPDLRALARVIESGGSESDARRFFRLAVRLGDGLAVDWLAWALAREDAQTDGGDVLDEALDWLCDNLPAASWLPPAAVDDLVWAACIVSDLGWTGAQSSSSYALACSPRLLCRRSIGRAADEVLETWETLQGRYGVNCLSEHEHFSIAWALVVLEGVVTWAPEWAARPR